MIPIIDTLAHPTLSSTWLKEKLNSSFNDLIVSMEKASFSKALAVGIWGIENYSHKKFIEACFEFDCLIPIAGLDTQTINIEREIELIKRLGFRGIKIHPRFSKMHYIHNQLDKIFEVAGKNNLVVMYCTYSHCSAPNYPEVDPFYALAKTINKCPDTRLVLVHGGDVSILKYAELARHNPNILLDLSLTMMKYEGSSIDNDIKFLFNYFDRKITIGTDFPEYSHQAVRKRFELFSKGIEYEKILNIAYKNVEDLFYKN